ncbi:MAG: hypothetical protein ONB16_05995 [candidate division KSB1 bacterium]|nr:hypothetical protein [candidate division KSB1 bacterium]MDZ7317793.1 hypothetical protein [candidate division KSB1 bacterium]MDZ7341676.1 hypothetical protein [candidate division KSB1 bacterium]
MRKMIMVILIYLCGSIHGVAQLRFPENNFVTGWVKSGQLLRFLKNDLYGYIDGGAELFYEFGFEELQVQNYQREEYEISLEAYRMENATAALGIYLMKCGQETPIEGVDARNSGNKYQINIVKGSYFIQVNSFAGREDLIPAAAELAQQLLASIAQGAQVKIFDGLPKKNLIAGSERIIRGPYSLQSIFTFGEGDIFQLKGKSFGVFGNYRDEDRRGYSQLVIQYPDVAGAQAAFQNLLKNLDPYLRVVAQNDTTFIFQDFEQKFGSAMRQNDRISVRFRLAQKPIFGSE